MTKYVHSVKELMKDFSNIKIEQVVRDCNSHADALAGLAAACDNGESRTITIGTIERPTIEDPQAEEVFTTMYGPSWMDDLIAYLKDDVLPTDNLRSTLLCFSPS